jgi:delta8-fatty-acid desaturase
MAAYRIGRKAAGPWTNMTPPIRGGIYRRAEPASDNPSDTDSTDDDGGSVSGRTSVTSLTSTTSTSRGSSVDVDVELDCQSDSDGRSTTLRRRIPGPSEGLLSDSDSSPAGDKHHPRLTADQYTDFAVQQGVDLDLGTYPSLDPATQRDITDKYRLLHERVKADGLYDCQYLAYGKELVWYSSLFAVFLVALRWEWYITSAVFLGLFWVRLVSCL